MANDLGPFEKKLAAFKQEHEDDNRVEALVFVHDTLQMSRAIANSVFVNESWEIVTAVYGLVVDRLEKRTPEDDELKELAKLG